MKFVLGRQTNQAKLTLSAYRHGSATELFADCLAAAADVLIAANGGPAWDEALPPAAGRGPGGAGRRHPGRGHRGRAGVLAVVGQVEGRLATMTNLAFGPATADLRAQLDDLIYPGWVTATAAASPTCSATSGP